MRLADIYFVVGLEGAGMAVQVNDYPMEYEEYDDDEDMMFMLKTIFVQKNQNRFNEIKQAIDTGNLVLARRLVHNIKGNAGQIKENKLSSLAGSLENILEQAFAKPGGVDSVPPLYIEALDLFKTEFILVLNNLKPLLDKSQREVEPLNAEQVISLFAKLEGLLGSYNPSCIDLLSELRTVPGAEELAGNIENMDLRIAQRTLAKLKKEWNELNNIK